jgi:hypothetical protein
MTLPFSFFLIPLPFSFFFFFRMPGNNKLLARRSMVGTGNNLREPRPVAIE